MAFLRKLLMFLAFLIGGLFVVSFFLPKEAHVERSNIINASPAKLFDYLNKTSNFNQWSPWFEMDPNAKYNFSGADIGVGGKIAWDGKETGKGSQEIIESNPYSDIKLELIFDGQAPAYAKYKLEKVDHGTKMTWSFDTALSGPVEKYVGLMMDSFVGDMYEKGLANLKVKAEALPDPKPVVAADNQSKQVPEVTNVDSVDLIVVSNRADFDNDLIAKALAQSYGQLVGYMQTNGVGFAGAPMAITTGGSPDEGFWAFDAAIPVDKSIEVASDSAIQFSKGYSGKAVKLTHIGSYSDMSVSYETLMKYVYSQGFEPNGNIWEQYLSDPGNTPESELVTHLYFPIK